MRLHCIADKVIVPESIKELYEIVQSASANYVYLAGGSNVVLPNKLHKTVVLLTAMPAEIQIDGNLVNVMASVRIQQLIRTMQKNGLGGIEYLFSVPCTVGGAVFMNAGRGEVYNQSISDYVVEVECMDLKTHAIVKLKKEECQFRYRHSIFASGQYVILSVLMAMNTMPAEEVESRIQERMQHARMFLDASKPSAGSIFRICNPKIMQWLKGVRLGGACWSKKTENWISNDNHASSRDVIFLIQIAQLLHIIFRKKCVREVILIK